MHRNKYFSLFKNVKQPEAADHYTVECILNKIKNPRQNFIDAILALRQCDSKDDIKEIKNSMPAITVSTQCTQRKGNENIIAVNGLIQVDLDNCEPYWKDNFTLHSCVLATFISPSGTGVKAIVAVDYNTIEAHEDAVYTVDKFLEENGFPPNDKVTDINRLMFISYDPDIYINFDAKPLSLLKCEKKEYVSKQYVIKDDLDDILKYISPDCDYDTWLKVGMSLKTMGESMSTWENWSMSGSKYKNGDCAKRWKGFGDSISKGTLIYFAKQNGYVPKNDFINVSKLKYSDFKDNEVKVSGKTKKGIPCGFFVIDRNILGLREGWLTVLTGREGKGKTTFGRQILLTYASNKIKSFMFFGEGEKHKEENLLALANGAEADVELMFGRNIYSASDKATDNFIDGIGKYIKILDIKPLMTLPVFECVFEEMKIKVQEGVKLFIIDNMMKLVTNYIGEKDLLRIQQQIIFNLKNFAMLAKVHIIIIAHPNKGGEEISGATEIRNTVDAILKYKRIENPIEEPAIRMLDWNESEKSLISAVVLTEKARDKSIYEPAYFKWSEKHNAIFNITKYRQTSEYYNKFHWTEFLHRIPEEDVSYDDRKPYKD